MTHSRRQTSPQATELMAGGSQVLLLSWFLSWYQVPQRVMAGTSEPLDWGMNALVRTCLYATRPKADPLPELRSAPRGTLTCRLSVQHQSMGMGTGMHS